MGAPKKMELDWWKLFEPIEGFSPGEFELVVKKEIIPIIFVPGIMGTRLKNNKGEKVWDPDAALSFMLPKYGLFWVSASDKKKRLIGNQFDENFLEPFEDDEDHNEEYFESFNEARARKWGSLSWSSYGKVLTHLHNQSWSSPLKACFQMPVYGFGYNWSGSNSTAGKKLKEFIDYVKKVWQPLCQKVIIVTHSMGGLVTRSAALEHGANESILGIIHGVQPATGAGAAYWRMKAGFERSDLKSKPAAWVLGTNGAEVTALLANMPGGLQLLPSQHYTDNSGSKKWVTFTDDDGKQVGAQPAGDLFEDVYKNKTDYWRLINPAHLDPDFDPEDSEMSADDLWGAYASRIDGTKRFHERVPLQPNVPTVSFHGAGTTFKTVDKAVYQLSAHGWKNVAGAAVWTSTKTLLAGAVLGPWGAGAYLAKRAITHSDWWESRGGFKAKVTINDATFEVVLQPPAGGGDGTVPESSGKAVKAESKAFEGISHEPAYQNDDVLKFTVEQIEKLCIDKIKAKLGR